MGKFDGVLLASSSGGCRFNDPFVLIIDVLSYGLRCINIAQSGGHVFSDEPRLTADLQTPEPSKFWVFKNGQVIHCGFSLYRNLYVLLLRLN